MLAPWLAVVIPLLLAPLAALLGRRQRLVAPSVAFAAAATALAVGVSALLATAAADGGVVSTGAVRWLPLGESALTLGWSVDGLAAVMLTVVGAVASCVVVFSNGYLAEDPARPRYFALIALFTAAMSTLVIADGFLTLFLGWELVGACSFLLIGFWFARPEAAAAATKAFLTTRVGDVALMFGIALLWNGTGTLVFAELFDRLGGVDARTLSYAVVLIALGAMGKSAQFPLHGWLPDAMEGPTPVSALIHAATMVAAGVYLVARVWPLFEASPEARLVLLGAGAISAFFGALIATRQRDIKKVLAYSTISQLGFMFCALGAGAPVAAMFHLVTHAAFKALLFLASGSVIHGSGTQDLHEMGGLRQSMPATFTLWLVGVLALVGLPPFAGFFSKDGVLEVVYHEVPGVAILLFAASLLTAFYAARTTRLAFFGPPAEEAAHPHESPLPMLLPLAVLAVAAAGLGFAGPAVARLLGHEPEPLAIAISVAAVACALAGGIAGWTAAAGRDGDERTAVALGATGRALAAALHWDRAVARVVVRPVVSASRVLYAFGDRLLADGAATGSAWLVRRGGGVLSRLQSGSAQDYAVLIGIGVVLMLILTTWVG